MWFGSICVIIPLDVIVVVALLDGSRHPSVDKPVHLTAGRNLTVACFFHHTGKAKFFCRDQCKDEAVFINTYSDTDRRGRYSSRYLEASSAGHSCTSPSHS
ncbi:hypothetical protein Q5P01_007112 [Channa striata]|uniref:Secreted protein n=1 Tax=Channa striata TaxID=64152 RepID=A0AA88N7N7_CHASR|nr:hypothetical protein Q5P01_007112 [Channa striata]